MNLLVRWVASAGAIALVAWWLPGIRVTGGPETVFVVALVLGLVNALVRPLVKMFSCGLIVLTLGIFLLVINAAMLWIASMLATHAGFGFVVADVRSALIGALAISLVSWALSLLAPDRD